MSRNKVVVIGLGKTGTSTLGVCLKTLGYKHVTGPYDLMVSLRKNTFEPLFEVLEQHDSADDFPWPYAYREIDARFPGTRFILTERRNPEVWLDSLKRHYDRTGPSKTKLLSYGSHSPYGREAEHIALYERHGREVREYFEGRPDDFLVMRADSGDGWEKLCTFLGEPIVERPFPHGNKDPRNPVIRTAESYMSQGRVSEAYGLLAAEHGVPVDDRVKVLARIVEFSLNWRGRKPKVEVVSEDVLASIRDAVAARRFEDAASLVIANRDPALVGYACFKQSLADLFTAA